MADFTKLSALVDQEFKVLKGKGYHFQQWDNDNRTMKKDDKWFEGAQKKYEVETDKGILTLGPGQLGALLQETYKEGEANINGVTFHVKSNGKSGMEIRYFFNVASQATLSRPTPQEDRVREVAGEVQQAMNEEGPIDLGDIPFN